MMKKVSLFKVLGVITALGFAVGLAACSNNAMDNGTNNDMAASGRQTVYGYIKEVNPQARVALIDRFELVSINNAELNSNQSDSVANTGNGYQIDNSSAGCRLYALAKNVNISLSSFDYSSSTAYNLQWNGDKAMDGDLEVDKDGLMVTPENEEDKAEDAADKDNTAAMSNITDNNMNTQNNMNMENKVDTEKNNTGNDNANQSVYSGTDLNRLNDRLDSYEHVPFLITMENGKIVSIEEMDSIYR